MKKRLLIYVSLVLCVVFLAGWMFYTQSVQYGQDTVVKVFQTDENGTPITSATPTIIVGKAGQRNKFVSDIKGYKLISRNGVAKYFPRKNQTVHLKYRAAATQSKLTKTVKEARYVQVGTQNTKLPTFNGTQLQLDGNFYGRLSTSRDGKNWTKLAISYPNESMDRPLVWANHGVIRLFDAQKMYETKDLRTWQRYSYEVSSHLFSQAKLAGMYLNNRNTPVLVVSAVDRKTKRIELYYGNWRGHKTISNWRRLSTGKVELNAQTKVVQANSKLFLLVPHDTMISVYTAANASQRFELMDDLELTLDEGNQINGLGLVRLSTGNMRLFYSTSNFEQVEQTTWYQDFNQSFDAVSNREQVASDFVWHDFNVMKNIFQ